MISLSKYVDLRYTCVDKVEIFLNDNDETRYEGWTPDKGEVNDNQFRITAYRQDGPNWG